MKKNLFLLLVILSILSCKKDPKVIPVTKTPTKTDSIPKVDTAFFLPSLIGKYNLNVADHQWGTDDSGRHFDRITNAYSEILNITRLGDSSIISFAGDTLIYYRTIDNELDFQWNEFDVYKYHYLSVYDTSDSINGVKGGGGLGSGVYTDYVGKKIK